MKRLIICLLLVTCLGCYDVEIDKLGRPGLPVYKTPTEVKKQDKVTVRYETKMLRLADLRENQIKLLKEKISLFENLIELQEGTINSQRETIASLQNLCRMYEAAVNSLVKAMESIKNMLEIQVEIEN